MQKSPNVPYAGLGPGLNTQKSPSVREQVYYSTAADRLCDCCCYYYCCNTRSRCAWETRPGRISCRRRIRGWGYISGSGAGRRGPAHDPVQSSRRFSTKRRVEVRRTLCRPLRRIDGQSLHGGLVMDGCAWWGIRFEGSKVVGLCGSEVVVEAEPCNERYCRDLCVLVMVSELHDDPAPARLVPVRRCDGHWRGPCRPSPARQGCNGTV